MTDLISWAMAPLHLFTGLITEAWVALNLNTPDAFFEKGSWSLRALTITYAVVGLIILGGFLASGGHLLIRMVTKGKSVRHPGIVTAFFALVQDRDGKEYLPTFPSLFVGFAYIITYAIIGSITALFWPLALLVGIMECTYQIGMFIKKQIHLSPEPVPKMEKVPVLWIVAWVLNTMFSLVIGKSKKAGGRANMDEE